MDFLQENLSPESGTLENQIKRLGISYRLNLSSAGLAYEIRHVLKTEKEILRFQKVLKITKNEDIDLLDLIVSFFLIKETKNRTDSPLPMNREFYPKMIDVVLSELTNNWKIGQISPSQNKINLETFSKTILAKPIIAWFLIYGLKIPLKKLISSLLENEIFIFRNRPTLIEMIKDIR